MAKDYYRDICQRLKDNGWVHLRAGKGSHEIWEHAQTARRVTVCHTKSRFTANEIIMRAAIEERF